MLFGSQARGEAHDASDVDVMIVLNGRVNPGAEIERTGESTAELCRKYGVLLSRLFVSDEDFGSNLPVVLNAREQGVEL